MHLELSIVYTKIHVYTRQTMKFMLTRYESERNLFSYNPTDNPSNQELSHVYLSQFDEVQP